MNEPSAGLLVKLSIEDRTSGRRAVVTTIIPSAWAYLPRDEQTQDAVDAIGSSALRDCMRRFAAGAV